MQPNEITISVDELGDGTSIVDEVFTRYEEGQNRTVYIGANHRPDYRNTMTIYRTFPTKSGNFKGVNKSAVKITQDVDVPAVIGGQTLVAPYIGDVSFSIPVGVGPEDAMKLRQRVIAAVDHAFMVALNNQLMV